MEGLITRNMQIWQLISPTCNSPFPCMRAFKDVPELSIFFLNLNWLFFLFLVWTVICSRYLQPFSGESITKLFYFFCRPFLRFIVSSLGRVHSHYLCSNFNIYCKSKSNDGGGMWSVCLHILLNTWVCFIQEGGCECYYKCIQQNCFMYFLCIQWTNSHAKLLHLITIYRGRWGWWSITLFRWE